MKQPQRRRSLNFDVSLMREIFLIIEILMIAAPRVERPQACSFRQSGVADDTKLDTPPPFRGRCRMLKLEVMANLFADSRIS